jgi:type VI secretion system protein ImpA
MPLRADILDPIAGDNPAGVNLRDDVLFSQIRELRRSDDDASRRPEDPPPKAADWPKVMELTSTALATKSKDLELAAWLTEALVRREGFAGLKAGLDLIRELATRYWDNLYPPFAEEEDEKTADRSARIGWVGSVLQRAVREVPLNKKGHGFFKYTESRKVGTEADCGRDEAKLAERQRQIDDGKLPAEEFDRAVDEAPKAWYKSLVADVEGATASLSALDTLCRKLMAEDPPVLSPLRDALAEVERVARALLQRKLELDPDPVAVEAAAEGDLLAGAEGDDASGLPVEPRSLQDAWGRIAVIARYLRQQAPSNPAPYLMLRGLRWGELRASGSDVDPKSLAAPPTSVRSQLKGFLLDGRWKDLLEACETLMARPDSRGWLDLQRYAVTACDNLGAEYEPVGRAIRGELALLLRDAPALPDMTLMDDTATANAETRQWLQSEQLVRAPGSDEPGAGGDGAVGDVPTPRTRPLLALSDAAFDKAKEAIRAGQVKRAIEILTKELERERSDRARFLRRIQIASVMVDAGLEALAKPLLDEALTQIDTHQLEEWESGELVAQPMSLLYRCLAKLDEDPDRRQQLYLRVARLDPVQAMALGS